MRYNDSNKSQRLGKYYCDAGLLYVDKNKNETRMCEKFAPEANIFHLTSSVWIRFQFALVKGNN